MLYDFLFPSFAEWTPKPPHILQKHSMSMWFLLAGCAFRQIAKGIGCLGTSKREKPGKIHHTVPGQQAWLSVARLLPVIKGMGWHGFQILWQGEVSTNLKLSSLVEHVGFVREEYVFWFPVWLVMMRVPHFVVVISTTFWTNFAALKVAHLCVV